MENLKLIELNEKELVETEGGFGPLYYLFAGAWAAGVAYGYITEKA
ncbi:MULTISPECIES: class IIb bacteriocin, lactobin A/cerein 7B family [Flavobacterium]|uniref:Class IIb bacteriocin, lactobin A/cerein 7B family n=2 Tax=Flavobacterium TaxID=237 RepID=A0ABN7EN08_9FLAO|nr:MULTISPECIES: class IIb bacteriocin, lactobin A/cerein 7B family [Flavobacterium]MCC9016529.1 class IIb bacteriocin, lactobin A/cerein 7B family [Flavobacterium sp. F-126]CAA9198939.1 hypothetical protein FLACOL7796_02478 [Flavobacterium collinsii]